LDSKIGGKKSLAEDNILFEINNVITLLESLLKTESCHDSSIRQDSLLDIRNEQPLQNNNYLATTNLAL
jgi:hypothetical protein